MSKAERTVFVEQEEDRDDKEKLESERGRRILIVDDDPDFLSVAEVSLAAHGFLVERAAGGLRGVFLATQDVPDVILCDLRMPGIDGFVVAEALRADPATQHVAIFACTGRRDLEARAALNASAFDGVLVKPIDWDSAARLLGQILGLRSPHRIP
jgi:CheY-like chemotaxis protein